MRLFFARKICQILLYDISKATFFFQSNTESTLKCVLLLLLFFCLVTKIANLRYLLSPFK